jgi:thiol-disulfide isomerase/thioredoxin
MFVSAVVVLRVPFLALLLGATQAAELRLASSVGQSNEQRGVPAYACPFTRIEAEAAKQVYALLPKPLHMVLSNGNITSDEANAQAIGRAGEKIEAEERVEAQSVNTEADHWAAKAQNDATKARMLSSEAKADAAKDVKAAQKESAQATALAKAAVNASEKAMELSANAEELEKAGISQGQEMASAAKEWLDVVKAEKTWKVKVVDESMLNNMSAKQDLLIIFYASWCPHCQTYVLHDATGNSKSTPALALNAELSKIGGPQVVLYDAEAHKVPKNFEVSYVPTLYSVTRDGKRSKYQGNPHDFDKVKQFLGFLPVNILAKEGRNLTRKDQKDLQKQLKNITEHKEGRNLARKDQKDLQKQLKNITEHKELSNVLLAPSHSK